jgi:regulator of protease activity HflC (stomatin/prohibitin superfamily)
MEKAPDNIHVSPIAGLVWTVFFLVGLIGAIVADENRFPEWFSAVWCIGWTIVGTFFLFAIKVAQQWEKVIVLRLGKFHGLRGPGLFWIIPVVDSTPSWIDHRVMVTPFNAEKTLTKDTVPVDVDAVLFWVIWDAEKAALEVADYRAAISPGLLKPRCAR